MQVITGVLFVKSKENAWITERSFHRQMQPNGKRGTKMRSYYAQKRHVFHQKITISHQFMTICIQKVSKNIENISLFITLVINILCKTERKGLSGSNNLSSTNGSSLWQHPWICHWSDAPNFPWCCQEDHQVVAWPKIQSKRIQSLGLHWPRLFEHPSSSWLWAQTKVIGEEHGSFQG